MSHTQSHRAMQKGCDTIPPKDNPNMEPGKLYIIDDMGECKEIEAFVSLNMTPNYSPSNYPPSYPPYPH